MEVCHNVNPATQARQWGGRHIQLACLLTCTGHMKSHDVDRCTERLRGLECIRCGSHGRRPNHPGADVLTRTKRPE